MSIKFTADSKVYTSPFLIDMEFSLHFVIDSLLEAISNIRRRFTLPDSCFDCVTDEEMVELEGIHLASTRFGFWIILQLFSVAADQRFIQ